MAAHVQDAVYRVLVADGALGAGERGALADHRVHRLVVAAARGRTWIPFGESQWFPVNVRYLDLFVQIVLASG